MIEARWLTDSSVTEWDLQTLIDLEPRQAKAARSALSRAPHHAWIVSTGSAALQRQLEAVEELALSFPIQALLVRINFKALGAEELLLSARRRLAPSLELWIDPGKDAKKIDTKLLRSQSVTQPRAIRWVGDPLWHPKSLWKDCSIYKLHGWHESRWVRYYGSQQLKLLMELCRKHKPEVLLLGHSKREEEIEALQALAASEDAQNQIAERKLPPIVRNHS
jgi:hypothetical protein